MKTNIKRLYNNRFSKTEQIRKKAIWKVLCNEFFYRYIPENAVVLDPAAGFCEFINLIPIRGNGKKIACDLNPEMPKHAGKRVITQVCSADNLSFLDDNSIMVKALL